VRSSNRLSPNVRITFVRKIRRQKTSSTQLRKSKMPEMLEKHRTTLEGNKSSESNKNSRRLRDRSEKKD
jgi:hypothetical protein